MADPTKDAPPSSSCPIDPAARAAWLETAKKQSPNNNNNNNNNSSNLRRHHSLTAPNAAAPRLTKTRPLALDRETSSIPRAFSSPSAAGPSKESTHPAPSSVENAQQQNWVYPSERQFYEALRRKNHNPAPTTISSIVPIHNAVNERAWASILSDWELRSPSAKKANAVCGGPRLRSFSGDSSKLTPRARVYGWLGYERPFDRHDWVVERCGGEAVEYVIDFYRGKGGGLSFFLDVRPKLNSWAGWKLRIGKWFGL